jgi:DNA replication and repair protein RecF
MWLATLELRDLRNLREVDLELSGGLNVFVGRNAQGKTSVLEGVGLIARGRSFRTDRLPALIRRGTTTARAGGRVVSPERECRLGVHVTGERRRLSVDGAAVRPRDYAGRFEVGVYSTDRLRVVRGTMRDRRQFVDRSAGALWPVYRRLGRDYERVLRQRNAALESGGRDLGAWTDGLISVGAELRQRRSDYVRLLQEQLRGGYGPEGERYAIRASPDLGASAEPAQREHLAEELSARAGAERGARRSLAGPHRDPILLAIEGEETDTASSGQQRSLLLALTLASLEVYRRETGSRAVTLLDDLDSELDERRAGALCERVARDGQALVTTAHRAWVDGIGLPVRTFLVEGGRVVAA